MNAKQFVAPTPVPWVMHATSLMNRLFLIKGIPVLRHVPGFRPVTRIVDIDFTEADRERLKASIKPGVATFITPNHPEFFTDWMIDKWLLDQTAPKAASWATYTIVNGMGRAMQRFWLANNLIAQIPGSGSEGKKHSVAWAAAGHGVLLHPEGRVGWHRNHIGQLYGGAIDMALRAYTADSVQEARVVPVAWKLVFTSDVSQALAREYRYICRNLGCNAISQPSPAAMVYHVYYQLLARDETLCLGRPTTGTFLERHTELLRRLEQNSRLVADVDRIMFVRRWLRIGPFIAKSPTMSQEEVAEHFKRIRADFCTKGLRNVVHNYVPRAVGPRRAHIRVGEPLVLARPSDSADTRELESHLAINTLWTRLQRLVDAIESEISVKTLASYSNPFHFL
jgi:hypothetical protein